MIVLPFLSSPCGYILQAYKSTRVEIPILANTIFGQKRVYKGSKEYDQLIETLPGYNIKNEFQPFCDRMGVRKDLIITEKLNLGFCSAQGTNFFTKGDAVIWVTPNFQRVDNDACNWVMKHEICHIKNNDCFTIHLVPAICSIAAATFSTFMMPVIPAILVTIIIGFIARAIFSQYREGKADDLAIAESSVAELKGGRRFLMALKAANLETRKTTWKKIVISSTGENRLDFLHPSTASRIRKIDQVLKQQNIKIDDQEELDKIAELKKLIHETNLQSENELKKIGNLGLMLGILQ